MSVREQDRQKTCPSRGLGIAAAAIGVGVGAALYYFFNKRSENPDAEGSTSSWTCEQPQTLHHNSMDEGHSFTTISEHSTTDTSMHDTSANSSTTNTSDTEDSATDTNTSASEVGTDTSNTSYGESNSSSASTAPDSSGSAVTLDDSDLSHSAFHQMDLSDDFDDVNRMFGGRHWEMLSSDGELTEDPPIFLFKSTPLRRRNTAKTKEAAQNFRKRTRSCEECSICFDAVLEDQAVMELPCTHRFHERCILPWLQERQTCPNCRTSAGFE